MKTSSLILLMAVLPLAISAQQSHDPTKYKPGAVCLSKEEKQLYELIMKYRKDNGLAQIPLSRSLCYVAQLHAWDLSTNAPVTGTCNLHSWSAKGPWKQVCYTDDHKKAELMWSKPKELTTYSGSGYEISCMSTNMSPAEALGCWTGSAPHNNVILNKGMWSQAWNAIGVGIMGDYAVIWFGNEKDPEKIPVVCP